MKINGKNYAMYFWVFVVSVFVFANWTNAQGEISFVVPIEVETFSKKATLKVRLWNARQMEISAKTGHCAVSYDMQTKTEEIHCPGGVKYQKPSPEEFSFPIGDINSSIEILSSTVQIGEVYRLQISGLSKDGCNTTSASINGEVDSKIIQLENLAWASTMRGCL